MNTHTRSVESTADLASLARSQRGVDALSGAFPYAGGVSDEGSVDARPVPMFVGKGAEPQAATTLTRELVLHGITLVQPDVSIVTPAFVSTPRAAALLQETLTTVRTQTHGNYEVVVVDDGSPLDLGWAAKHPHTRVIRQSNHGPAEARNAGIAVAAGRNFVFLDADDHLLPKALESGLEILERHPEVGFCVGAREEMTYEGAPVPWDVGPPPGDSHLYESLLGFDWYIIPPSSVVFRRAVVQAVGGFRDPWGADDLDFYLRAAWSFEAACHSTRVTRYRRYSASSSRDGVRMLRSVRAVYARQWRLVKGNASLERAYRRGLQQLVTIFHDCLVENVADRARAGNWSGALESLHVLARERPYRLLDAAKRAYRARRSRD
jgi:glycosyltransferase involved in cell wall biosynthesis